MRFITAAWLLLLVWAIVRHGRRSVLLVALAANLLLAVTFGAQPAHACSCTRLLTPEEERQGSDAVFSGLVLAVDIDYVEVESDFIRGPGNKPAILREPYALVTFDVEESWKGVSEEPIVIHDYMLSTSCGIGFHEGERYLVFANYDKQGEDTSLLRTMACSGTKPLSAAGADLQALGPAELVLPETVEPAELAQPETVEPESIDLTPASSTWSFSDWIITGAVVALLSLVVVGSFLFRRRRHLG